MEQKIVKKFYKITSGLSVILYSLKWLKQNYNTIWALNSIILEFESLLIELKTECFNHIGDIDEFEN